HCNQYKFIYRESRSTRPLQIIAITKRSTLSGTSFLPALEHLKIIRCRMFWIIRRFTFAMMVNTLLFCLRIVANHGYRDTQFIMLMENFIAIGVLRNTVVN